MWGINRKAAELRSYWCVRRQHTHTQSVTLTALCRTQMQLQETVVSASSTSSPYRVMSRGWTLKAPHTHKLNDILSNVWSCRIELCIVRDTSVFNSVASCLSHSHKCFGLNMFFKKYLLHLVTCQPILLYLCVSLVTQKACQTVKYLS